MRPYPNLTHVLRRQLRSLLSVLPLVSGAILLVALLTGPVGLAASRTLFQSPAATPTATVEPTPSPPPPSPTNTQVATPTNTATATPQDTPQATPTVPKPTHTRSAATSTSSPLPTATLAPVGGVIQMPRLPSIATVESSPPTPVPTVASESFGSSKIVGGAVVVVLLVLAIGVGLITGNWLRNLVPGS